MLAREMFVGSVEVSPEGSEQPHFQGEVSPVQEGWGHRKDPGGPWGRIEGRVLRRDGISGCALGWGVYSMD